MQSVDSQSDSVPVFAGESKQREEAKMEPKEIEPLKYCLCGRDHGRAVLMVDIETELIPLKDDRGNWLYFCLKGHHILPVLASCAPAATEGETICEEEVQKEYISSGWV